VVTEYDEIGVWSEVKLAIVRKYAAAYSTIMEATRLDCNTVLLRDIFPEQDTVTTAGHCACWTRTTST
jgi:hypothetical protein